MTMKKAWCRAFLRFGFATFVASSPILSSLAVADTSTATLGIEATVAESCGVNGSTLNFGTYTSGQIDDLDADSAITFTSCPAGQLVFELDGGQTGNTASRAMSNGAGGTLAYQIYTNSSRTVVWGTGAASNELLVIVPGSGSIPVYGRIAGRQTVPSGAYVDTINITMTF